MMIDSNTTKCVHTPDLENATEILVDTGQVVLCGPPGCGKTTLALALLRKCREDGFTPHIISNLVQLDSADIKKSVMSGLNAFLLDGTLGIVRVEKRQQYDFWVEKRSGLMDLVDQGRCRLIITVYPHVLQEVRQLERGTHSPLSDRSLIVEVGKVMDAEVKIQMLDFHLKKLQLGQTEHRKVVETVLQTDRSGPGFPWCCHHLVQHWSSFKDLAIFSAPEETHALIFDRMLTHPDHSKLFAAVLALIMRGVHGFLHRPGQAQPELTRLGFDAFSDDQLAEYADVLHGSVLTEDGKDFTRRVLYDAAALALGRCFRLPMMLKVCDTKFLVEHVQTRQVVSGVNGERKIKLCITVGLPVCSSTSRQVLTTPEDLQSLLQKVVDEIMSGHLPEICQHPSLQCPEFLLALEQYCQTHNLSVQRLVRIMDHVHGLPLVYWSVSSRSHTLLKWCLTQMTQTKSDLKHLFPAVLLACALFDQLLGNSTCRLQYFPQGALTPKHFSYKAKTMELPLPLLAADQCLTKEILQKELYYLRDHSLPISSDMITILVSGEKMNVQVRDRRQWYMAQRLLIDREVDERDQEGNSLLHLAVRAGFYDVIELAVKSGCHLLGKNGKGETPFQVAQSRRGQQGLRGDSSVGDYFTAIRSGDTMGVKTLLCSSVCVADKDSNGNTGLHVACQAGQGDIADLLIQLGADVNTKDKLTVLHSNGIKIKDRFTTTPLHLACLHSQTHIVSLLIRHGAHVNSQSQSGKTALHYACQSQSQAASVAISRLLLDSGADVNSQDDDENTPLHYAVRQGSSDTVSLLISCGADVNVRNKNKHTPLYYACRSDNPSTVKLLIQSGAKVICVHQMVACGDVDALKTFIQQGADVNQNDPSMECSPLHVACAMGHNDLVTGLMQWGGRADVRDVSGYTPLHYALKQQHLDTAGLLIELGAGINEQSEAGITPLHHAASKGHTSTAEFLINHQAEINVHANNGCTPLHFAVSQGHTATADVLMHQGASLNLQDQFGDTPLHKAARRGYTSVVCSLIQHGADVNAQNEERISPLHCAASEGLTDTIDLLVHQGANVNVQDNNGLTPLHWTVAKGHKDTVDLLIHSGADINAQNNIYGVTPLHYAAIEGLADIAGLLIRHGCTINVQEKNSHTPLHFAVMQGHRDTVELQIHSGADIDVQNKHGMTPLHFAVWYGHSDIASLLGRHGAKIRHRPGKFELRVLSLPYRITRKKLTKQ